ncbi:alpha/beta fold hydrolase [Bosea sp. TAB14]|uniref:alpha/beta fold hydrolase n=1 Tax=Bosea sp. TAB14 TaxID=3237481 RepID=UPI003F904FA7
MTTTSEIIDFRAETDDGATLHCFREGHGQPLLLVSGLSGTAGFWTNIAATLGRSFEIIRFDQRGIGGSSRGEAPCDIERLARDGLAVLDAAGLDRAGCRRSIMETGGHLFPVSRPDIFTASVAEWIGEL